MVEVILSYPTPEGSQEIKIDRERTTFGRGSDADHRFPDNGLSRLHATVYFDNGRVWVVDENSSNGTFVNGRRTEAAGTPLYNGDSIKIGNETNLKVHLRTISEGRTNEPKATTAASAPLKTANSGPSGIGVIPVIMIAVAVTIFSVTLVFVGLKLLVKANDSVAEGDDSDPIIVNSSSTKDKDPDAAPTPTSKPSDDRTPRPDDSIIPDSGPSKIQPTGYTMPAGKKYLDLSDSERRQYLSDRAMKIAQIIGNNSSEAIPAAALDKIKGFADGYAKRISTKPLGGCRFGDNLQVTYERASKNAPFIIRAFNEKGTDPRIGLYLAMIESEHCVCLQSPTGPLGMFQFTYATAKLHFVPSEGVIKGASISNPDDRCKPEPAARAAASYMKALTGRYGTGPASVPLAIGSYNSGEGGLSSNLQKALDSNSGLPRDFWTLIANGEMLSKQFQSENFKYVPKFFAAAIIGENPQDFGLNLQPLSTYSK